MTDKTLQTKDIDYMADRISRLESSVQFLDYRLKKENPSGLSDRVIILEQRFELELDTLKREFSEAKKEARLKMTERLVYVSIIVGLITTLITLKIVGRI